MPAASSRDRARGRSSHGGATEGLAAAVTSSDELYFSLAAEARSVGPVRLYRCPGLDDVPAAMVAVGIHGDGPPGTGPGWVDELRRHAGANGAPQVRTYLSRGADDARQTAAAALAAHGATPRTEVALAAAADEITPPSRPLRLTPITDDAGWEAKAAVHAADAHGPDGHRVDPLRWLALERAKARSPQFRPVLVTSDEIPVGTCAVIDTGSIVRLKNLVLLPAWRGQGLAGDILGELARTHPGRVLGCMAVQGSPAQRSYGRAGLQAVGTVDEWTMSLP